MALFKITGAGAALEDLLDRERAALLSGNLESLSRLLPEKARLIRLLRENSLPESRLEILRQKARRNRTLLGAAQNGIKSVLQQLPAAENRPQSFQTYDLNGTSRKLRNRKPTELEKRA